MIYTIIRGVYYFCVYSHMKSTRRTTMDTRRESKRMDPARRHFGFALNQGTPAFNAFFLRIVTSSSSVVCLGLCVEQKARTLPLVLFSRLKPHKPLILKLSHLLQDLKYSQLHTTYLFPYLLRVLAEIFSYYSTGSKR